MTPPNSPPTPSSNLSFILNHLLPLLLTVTTSVKAFTSRFRSVHSNLLSLQSALTDASNHTSSLSNPLFIDLLNSLLPILRTLQSLSSRCMDASLPSGRLLLQSDIDIASSSLTLLLNDLTLLIRSGVLSAPPNSSASSAIVLPIPGPNASNADLSLFVRDAFARLQIGSLDLKLKAMTSLHELLDSDPVKLSSVIVEEGDLPAVIRLLDGSAHSILRDRAAATVSLLATSSAASRRAVFEEGGLGPLLRLLESGSAASRERAAVAIEAITADPGSSWAVSAYGGVPVLLNACRAWSGSANVQALVVAALKNVASIDDVRVAIVEEGGFGVLIDVVASGTVEAQKSAVQCLWLLTSMGDVDTQSAVVKAGALPSLLQCFHEAADQELQEGILRAVHSLVVIPAAVKTLCSSPQFFVQLADLIRRGTSSVLSQQTAAMLIADLAPGIGDDMKRCMAPCMAALVEMMEAAKPDTLQESAARALLALMTVKQNQKELVRDEKSVRRLVQMLDHRNVEVQKKFPVSLVFALAMSGGNGTRRRLVDAGACQHLQKLADAEVPGAKKALQRITGGRLKNLFSKGWSN